MIFYIEKTILNSNTQTFALQLEISIRFQKLKTNNKKLDQLRVCIN